MRKNRASISLTKKVIVCAFNGKTYQNLICEGSDFVRVSKLYSNCIEERKTFAFTSI
jgi:hypothetical protein